VENALEKLRPERISAEVDPVFSERVATWARGVLRDLGQEAAFDVLNPLIDDHLEELSSTRIRGITDTTREALRETLADGVRAGEDMPTLRERVREVFADADRRRATVIARTEVIRSSNWATYEAHKASGVVESRRWVATPGDRTRAAHRALNNQETSIDGYFVVPEGVDGAGKKAKHPGDFNVAELDIQCRCTTTAVIVDPDAADGFEGFAGAVARVKDAAELGDLSGLWKRYDEAAQAWEDDAVSALRRGFAAQLEDVLAALRD
jgi:uncharacterized protein with gpF-like domain